MKADSVTKDYMKQSTIFADAFNFLLYEGKQVIRPENLSPMDPAETGIIRYTKEKQEQTEIVQKYRDVLKSAVAMEDGKAIYLVLGIENQNRVHYAMPVRNGLYDFVQYAGQVKQTAQLHRKQRDWENAGTGEYLSGFYKEDRLIPVITLVIYFQPTPWDGPRTLSQMLTEHPPQIKKYISDYRINLIEPASLTEEEFSRFQTELGAILKFLKQSNDKDSMHKLVHEDQNYQRISREGANLLSVCTGIRMERKVESEVVDVCKAVEDMIKDAVAEKERTMCKAIDGMIKDAVAEKERTMCKAIDGMIKDAVAEKEREMNQKMEDLKQLLIEERCSLTGCTQNEARMYFDRKLNS